MEIRGTCRDSERPYLPTSSLSVAQWIRPKFENENVLKSESLAA
jgi:hypothetical protein